MSTRPSVTSWALAAWGGLFANSARGLDCNGNGLEDAPEIQAGAATDCNGNAIPDDCDTAAPAIGFARPLSFETARAPASPVLFDADGDGDLDLALRHRPPPSIAVFLNDGAGNLSSPALSAAGLSFPSLDAGDLDGDSLPELVAATTPGERPLAVYRGVGSGRFEPWQEIALAPHTGVSGVVVDDLNADGQLDVLAAVPGALESSLVTLLNDGSGRLQVAEMVPCPLPNLTRITLADLDARGAADALCTGSSETAYLYRSPGGGRFAAPLQLVFENRSFMAAAAADLTGDGAGDFAILLQDEIRILARDGQGGLDLGRVHSSPGSIGFVQASDFDANGTMDLVTAAAQASGCGEPPREIRLFALDSRGNLAGSYRSLLGIGFHTLTAAAGDLNADGRGDLAVCGGNVEVPGLLQLMFGDPAPSPFDCDTDGVPDDCELDCDANGVPDVCEIGVDPRLDCDANGLLDTCDADHGADCDASGVPDACELRDGTIVDCDGNLVPDACELEARDLDGNGALDLCETLSGAAPDCNQNGAPDSIDLAWRLRFRAADVQDRPAATTFAAGDFDDDGDLDLALVTGGTCCPFRPGALLLRLNDGRGRFASSSPVGTEMQARLLLSGDFDADGRNDLATWHDREPCGSSPLPGLKVYLRTGEGDFRAIELTMKGLSIQTVAIGNLDGDADLDFALLLRDPLNASNLALVPLLHERSGTFTERGAIDLGAPSLHGLIAADLDRDGADELVAADNSTVTVFAGSLASQLPRRSQIGLGTSTLAGASLGAADLDEDGDADLFALEHKAAMSTHDARVLRNDDGSLSLVPAQPLGLQVGRERILATDIDGDARTDLAALGAASAPGGGPGLQALAILRNAGGGQLEATRHFTAPGHHYLLAVSDLDGDGSPDLLLGETNDGRLVILSGDPAGGFVQPHPRPLAEATGVFAPGDLDADGREDLVITESFNMRFLHGGEAAELDEVRQAVTSRPVALASADFDQDGDLDVATANDLRTSDLPDTISVLSNLGSRRFTPPLNLAVGHGAISIVAQDLNGDRWSDLFAVNARSSETAVLLNQTGRWLAVDLQPLGYVPGPAAGGDLDGDGDADVAVVNAIAERVAIRLNDGSARFTEVTQVATVRNSGSLAAVELDGDLAIELVTVGLDFSTTRGRLAVVDFRQPDGFTAEAHGLPTFGSFASSLTPIDLGGDGHLDLAVADGSTYVTLVQSLGARRFAAPVQIEASAAGYWLAAADLDGDFDADLAAAHPTGFWIAENVSGPPSADRDRDGVPDECGALEPARFIRGDANADSRLDIADAVFTLAHLFSGDPLPRCADAADADDDGRLALTDAVFSLGHLFRGGPSPPPPYPGKGEDPTPDRLGCRNS